MPDGSINPGAMTSFNHYALGSVAEWLHSTVGGISALSPGWKRILFAPIPGGTLTSAKVRYLSPYGMVVCEWTLEGEKLQIRVTVPPNSVGEVRFPGLTEPEVKSVGSGTHEFECRFVAGEWPPKGIIDPFSQPDPDDELDFQVA